MKTFQRLPSAVMMAAAAAIVGIPILRCPQEWQVKLFEPDTFLVAFALTCTAILLWVRSEPKATQQ